jgi:hypothetical protein
VANVGVVRESTVAAEAPINLVNICPPRLRQLRCTRWADLASAPALSAARMASNAANASVVVAEKLIAPMASSIAALWIRPELLAEVQIAEMKGSGKLRQATFKGLREDLV